MTVGLMAVAIRELRARSGGGLMDCKKALVAHNWIADDALEHLRCSGQAVVRRKGSLKPCGCPV